jgi:bla regulator protein blaR1
VRFREGIKSSKQRFVWRRQSPLRRFARVDYRIGDNLRSHNGLRHGASSHRRLGFGEPSHRGSIECPTIVRGPASKRAMRNGCVTTGAVVALATSVAMVSASAQTRGAAPAATERFDVTSVKPNKGPVEAGMAFVPRPKGFAAQNVTLRMLVMLAYQVRELEIVGGPGWMASDRFDIAGTIESPDKTDDDALQRMLQALLAERFKLRVHQERRELPMYALVASRPDRTLGARLRPFTGECIANPTRGAAPVPETPNGLLPVSEPAKGPQPCLASPLGVGRLSARGLPMTDLAVMLARLPAVSRRVVDRTGLAGRFDYDLEWTPTVMPSGASPAASTDPSNAGPNLFTALQEQLGLKLEPGRETLPVLVIDSVEQPSPD